MATNMRPKLLDELDRGMYTSGLIATYRFDWPFFEEYALPKLSSIPSTGNLAVLLDNGQYHTIAQTFRGSGGDAWEEIRRPRRANIHYQLLPVSNTPCFHPKIILLGSRKRALLIVGSANLTEQGLGSNAEVVGVFRAIKGKVQSCPPIIKDALGFFRRVVDSVPNTGELILHTLEEELSWLLADLPTGSAAKHPRLLHNLDKPLLEQLIQQHASEKPRRLLVTAPFFSGRPDFLNQVLNLTRADVLEIFVPESKSNFPETWISRKEVQTGKAKLWRCNHADSRGIRQISHAKLYCLDYGTVQRIAYGSANFSHRALWEVADKGNTECLVLVPPVRLGTKRIAELIDPLGTSQRLLSFSELETQDQADDDEPAADLPIHLLEARLEAPDIHVTFEPIREAISTSSLELALQAHIGEEWRLPFVTREARVTARCSEADAQKLDQMTAVAWIADPSGTPLSNTVLLANPHAGSSRKRVTQSKVREAGLSRDFFLQYLEELIDREDSSGLKDLLRACEITLTASSGRILWRSHDMYKLKVMGTVASRRPRFQWNAGLTDLGLEFLAKHQRRLKRHSDCNMRFDMERVYHVVSAMGRIAVIIMEQELSLLSGLTEAMSPHDWGQARRRLNGIIGGLEELLEVVCDDIPKKACRARGEANHDSLREIGSEADELVHFLRSAEERLRELCREHLRVRRKDGRQISPQFFPGDRIEEGYWSRLNHRLEMWLIRGT
ncbi:hypothetical protein KQI84_08695 [bacterium]|nr:hypothetical protein [bacterium]